MKDFYSKIQHKFNYFIKLIFIVILIFDSLTNDQKKKLQFSHQFNLLFNCVILYAILIKRILLFFNLKINYFNYLNFHCWNF